MLRATGALRTRPHFLDPILFDVTLRNAIEIARPSKVFTTKDKIEILHKTCKEFHPAKVELGAFVFPYAKYPKMADTCATTSYVQSAIEDKRMHTIPFVFVADRSGLQHAFEVGARNFSMSTSVSDVFLVNRTGKDMLEDNKRLRSMLDLIRQTKQPCLTKLNVSCVSQCPYVGKQRNDRIVYKLLSFCETGFDEICLCDTMGSLKYIDFVYILRHLLHQGVPVDKLSVHLHVNNRQLLETTMILYECFNQGLRRFDVAADSVATTCGNNRRPNMTYEFFYTALDNYTMDDMRHYNGL